MKKIIIAAIASALFLAGCGSDDSNTPDTLVQTQNIDSVFVEVLRENVDSTRGVSDSDLIDLGQTICKGLDAGLTVNQIGSMGFESGLPAEEFGFVVGASIAAFCPEYKNQVGT